MQKSEPFSQWPNKLQELDGIPGHPAHDTDRLWKELEGRRKMEKSSSPTTWKWIAAACFLFISAGLWRKDSTAPFVNDIEISEQQKSELLIKPETLETNQKSKPLVLTVNKNTKEKSKILKASIPENIDNKNLSLLDTTFITLAPAPDKAPDVLLKPTPKKLKQVHLNEIDRQPGPEAFTRQLRQPREGIIIRINTSN